MTERNWLFDPPGLLRIRARGPITNNRLVDNMMQSEIRTKIADSIRKIVRATRRVSESQLTIEYDAEVIVMTRAEFENVVNRAARDYGFKPTDYSVKVEMDDG